MERIDDPARAEDKVLSDMRALVSKVRALAAADLDNVREEIGRLREIRSAVYEDLNQIQHEYLILRGLLWVMRNGFGSGVAWEWNPRQTGNGREPDLRGSVDGRIVVSAEGSASENPVGTIDTRMRKTLEKLGEMGGQKFYFVCSDAMACRARTKIARATSRITVVQILGNLLPTDEPSMLVP